MMIQNISVIGAGTMGHGIAMVFAMHGCRVSLYESFDAVRETVLDKIRDEMQFMVDEDYIPAAKIDETLANITVFADLAPAVKDADYVIEAIPERMDLKQELFANLDRLCPAHTVFATNTSSLKLSEMIKDLPEARQKLCMVSHWYNPAYLLPIAELSKFGNMDEDVFNDVYDLYVRCEKQPVRVLKDIPGMVANRLLHAQAREAFYLVETGAAAAEDVDKALKYGPCFRNATTGMLEVADMGGLDIWLAAEDNMFPALNNSDKASAAMRELVEQGHKGIKTGKGFFDYPEETRQQVQNDFYRRLILQLKASKNY
ncbi:MAG: 3-hydroxyacyl-CoA dehydrogenase family protein [Oscillospiraceae bacterium]|nr:3-hydroxyacyl-CoA dehydrogenase family protein [Oscillospiraceae bacterium]